MTRPTLNHVFAVGKYMISVSALVSCDGEWDQRAVLCGACGVELTIRQYMQKRRSLPAIQP